MGEFGVAELVALLTSVGFGVISAVVPVVNAEAYVIASQVSHAAGPVPVAIGIGIGQTIGKLLLFLGVRRGKDFPFVRHRRERLRTRPAGRVRVRTRAILAALLALVGQKRWGLPIVFIAAVVGIPPLYAVALLAGATQMRALWFGLVVLVGRIARFVLVALGGGGLHDWWF
jgi:membrane protein YqaA with SNARE-associated domain